MMAEKTKGLPKYAFRLETSHNGYNIYERCSYPKATITIYIVQPGYDGKFWLDKVCEITYNTNIVSQYDVISGKLQVSPIQPAAYYQQYERWEYAPWYGQKFTVASDSYGFVGAAKSTIELIGKIDKTRADYNLAYRYADPLELMIHTLLKMNYCQVYTDKGDDYLNAKGVFLREDRDHSRELAEGQFTQVIYPWDKTEEEKVIA